MRRLLVNACCLFLLAIFGLTLVAPSTADGLSGSEFNAGNIMSDSVFFDGHTTTENQVQAFLSSKVPSCDTWGTQPSSHAGYATRADWGRANGNPPPYKCLRDYVQNTSNKPAEAGLCNGYSAATESAAQIINRVAQSCGVNPKTLIVLLQKEQSLITDDWPWPIQYRSATGYGCPDTAPCDAEYYGFFNQVYAAARQFKRYAQGGFNYKANFNNYIQYNPNASCGGSNVFVQNQATAGLYNYTPYQPNAAALNNLYGTGNSCSAYGNRNFWRMFNDWFGSTQGGSFLLRTVNNATVYLVVNNNKYPISDPNVMNSLAPLGPVGYVSDNYLASKTTGDTVGRLIRGEDGTVYFMDSGIKLPFTSCTTIAHYGHTCGDAITLTPTQINAFHTGPTMSRLYGTTSGKVFYIENGTKHEAMDKQALQANGHTGAYNVLREAAINNLSYSAPLMRDNAVVLQRGSTYKAHYYQGIARTIDASLYPQSYLASISKGSLDPQSVALLTKQTLNGFVTNGTNSASYILTSSGKVQLTDPARWSSSYGALPDGLLSSIPTATSTLNNGIIKDPNSGTVYYVLSKQKRPFASWDDLTRISSNPSITTISKYYTDRLTAGVRVLGPGKLVKAPESGTVYVIDGLSRKFPITTFASPADMGMSTAVTTVGSSVLNVYTTQPSNLAARITCGGKNYFGTTNNGMYEVPVAMQTHYQLTYTTLDSLTCANIKLLSNQVTRFIRTPDGTVYYIENGTKRPFHSYSTYIAYGGGSTATVPVSYYGAGQLPTGSPAQ